MSEVFRDRVGSAFVAILLVAQIVVFGLSMDAVMQISVFCTASRSSAWGIVFGFVHLLLLGLIPVGLMSFLNVRLRRIYIVLVSAAMLALPVQAYFVSHDILWCDAP